MGEISDFPQKGQTAYIKKLKTYLQTFFEILSFGIITYLYIKLTFISSHFAKKKKMNERNVSYCVENTQIPFSQPIAIGVIFLFKVSDYCHPSCPLSNSLSLSVSVSLFFLLCHIHTLSLSNVL
jgi:hypothetical protein